MNTPAPAATALYAAHEKVYAREVSGRFARLRILAVVVLLGLFYGVSWLRWDHRQAVLFDLPARKFYVFGLTFFPQDFILLTWLLVIAAYSLFFFTAIAGRLWCGFACPQTVWTEIYMWMERITEGGRSRQMKLDRKGWNAEKLGRKAAKQALWITFSLFTGFAFVGYFTPVRELARGLLAADLGGWQWFWVSFYAFATYGNAGYMREQVCKYMCPYARFQSAMFDKSTLIIAYDDARGEPRSARRHEAGAVPAGDCIDCTLCVQVCPTGIDIRKGLQYECIACAACVDACDQVMTKISRPTGLIRYSTLSGKLTAKRLLRPRVLAYGVLLSLLVAGFVWAVIQRVPLNVDVLKDRNTLARELPDGRAEDVYNVRIINKDEHPHRFTIRAEGLPQLEVDSDSPTPWVGAESVRSVVIRVRAPAKAETRGSDIRIITQATDAPEIERSTRARFFFPR